jgi:hypothetical protein
VRTGQLLIEMKENGQRASIGKPKLDANSSAGGTISTLADLGISEVTSHRWQRAAREAAEAPKAYKQKTNATIAKAWAAMDGAKVRGTQGTGENEWCRSNTLSWPHP